LRSLRYPQLFAAALRSAGSACSLAEISGISGISGSAVVVFALASSAAFHIATAMAALVRANIFIRNT
jgi:hypothetical protein